MEILAHPLRQEILIFIEQEGETGYKDLKLKFNVATGTLYHHLRILKGLIEQNSFKKYVLTDDGRKALDVIFQEQSTKSIVKIIPPSIPSSDQIVTEGETIQNEQLFSTKTAISKTEQTINQNFFTVRTFFNINEFMNKIPTWVHYSNIFSFFILFLLFEILQPKFVFFHFVPIAIQNIFYSFFILVFPGINIAILGLISIIKKERINLSTIGILFIYYNLFSILTIVTNIFQLYTNDLVIRILSIVIQGLFIFFWTLSISLQYYSWEKSLFLAILQNYLLFLLF